MVFDASEATISELLKAVQDAGFAAELLQKQEDAPRMEVLHPASGPAMSAFACIGGSRLACMCHCMTDSARRMFTGGADRGAGHALLGLLDSS